MLYTVNQCYWLLCHSLTVWFYCCWHLFPAVGGKHPSFLYLIIMTFVSIMVFTFKYSFIWHFLLFLGPVLDQTMRAGSRNCDVQSEVILHLPFIPDVWGNWKPYVDIYGTFKTHVRTELVFEVVRLTQEELAGSFCLTIGVSSSSEAQLKSVPGPVQPH